MKQWVSTNRLGGLRRFAAAITLLTIAGQAWLGFEQSYAQPLVALATAYCMELLLEAIEARSARRTPRFAGGVVPLMDFLLSAHITGLAVALLLYANDRLLVIAFAVAVAIGSKAVFRVSVGTGTRHFLNPSNLGISATLLLFPWVGIAQPYMFTENIAGVWDWVLPGAIVISGTFLNARFTGKLPLITSWLCAFALQALLRSLIFDTPLAAPFLPITGMAFLLFTFYMISDPATTPSETRSQIVFGAAVAAAYGLLVTAHVVFGLFFALTAICALRGLSLYVQARIAHRSQAKIALEAVPTVREA